MRAGRFFCVALPLILCLGSIIALLVAVLAGVAHNRMYMFEIRTRDLTVNAGQIRDLIDGLDLDDIRDRVEDASGDVKDTIKDNLPEGVDYDDVKDRLPDGVDLDDINLDDIDLGKIDPSNLEDSVKDIFGNNKVRRQDNDSIVTRKTLGLGEKYEVTLWGYCRIDDGDRNCTDNEWDWANKQLNTDTIENLINLIDSDVKIPKQLKDGLDVYKTVSKWTQVAFVVALLALGIEFVIGIFANCTRVISCIVWLWAGLTTIIVIVTASLATATAAIVVGTVEAAGKKFDVHASLDGNFLATIWIGAAFSIAAGLFWIFTICCCKPEDRKDRTRYRDSDGGEKLLPGSAGGQYGRIGEDHEMTGGYSGYGGQPSPGYSPGFAPPYNQPQYPRGARSDLAYEPYSNRA